MNKAQFWERIWIPFTKRLPPETDEPVLLWHPIDKVYSVHTAAVALYCFNAFKEGREISQDRLFSDWCFLNPPRKRKR